MKKKVKKVRVKLLPIVVLIIIICMIGIIILYNNKYSLSYKKSITIDISSELPTIKEYIRKKDYDKLDDLKIKYNKIEKKDNLYVVGTYSGYIIYGLKKYKITLKIVDNEKPTIDNVRDINIYKGENVDLISYITYKDNSGNVTVEVKGNYDINKVGTYKLSYVAKDKSGNKTIKNFNLNVIEKSENNSNSNLTSNGYVIENNNGITYIDNVLVVNKTYSLPENYNPGDLTIETRKAFNDMKADALSISLNIYLSSTFRSYNTQNTLYNNYVSRDGKEKADTYSARPGHSEHQSGLAFDLNSVDDSFADTDEGKWVHNNCYKYGLIIRYPKGKEEVTGYMYESWHLRYVGVDLATKLYNNGNWISLEEYFGITSEYNY